MIMNSAELHIPEHLKDRVEFLYLDGNPENKSRSNMTYRFKDGPIEIPDYPGFYYIPEFTRYGITREGVMIGLRTERVRKWTVVKPDPLLNTTGGYRIGSAIDDWGERKGISRHRVLCLTFKEYTVHPKNYHVNHIDGVPGNDTLNNLELITPGENVQHAYDNGLFPNRLAPVDALNFITGEKRSFRSIAEASRAIPEIIERTIRSRLLRDNGNRYPDGWRFKRPNDSWSALKERPGMNQRLRPVASRNIFTGEVIEHQTTEDAARYTEVPATLIKFHVDEVLNLPIDGFNFRDAAKPGYWPDFTERHLQIFKERPKRPGNGVVVTSLADGEEMFFTQLTAAGRHFGISPITVGKLAFGEGERKGYRFKLFRIREHSTVPYAGNRIA